MMENHVVESHYVDQITVNNSTVHVFLPILIRNDRESEILRIVSVALWVLTDRRCLNKVVPSLCLTEII